jgi:hypothetical protein
VIAVVLAAYVFPFVAVAQDTAHIDALIPQLQGKSPKQVRDVIVGQFGAPTRDIGSGFQIEQWDIDGGVLTFHSLQGPTFLKNGVVTHLIRTNNPVDLCLFGNYEMVTAPEGQYGTKYWLGNVSFTANHYYYTDSHDNLDHRQKQTNNFFMLHPKGLVQVEYPSGVTPQVRLEDLPNDSLVATVTFTDPDRRFSKTYRIVTNRTSMSLAFEGDGIQFQMARGWVNYWR